MKDIKEILVCMGSSCFARGNTENLDFIEKFLKDNKLDTKIILSGSRCLGKCADGPNVVIDGVVHHNITPQKLKEIFDE